MIDFKKITGVSLDRGAILLGITPPTLRAKIKKQLWTFEELSYLAEISKRNPFELLAELTNKKNILDELIAKEGAKLTQAGIKKKFEKHYMK